MRALVEEHGARTGSTVAERLLADWANSQQQFVRVMSRQYKQVLADRAVKAAA